MLCEQHLNMPHVSVGWMILVPNNMHFKQIRKQTLREIRLLCAQKKSRSFISTQEKWEKKDQRFLISAA